MDLTTPALVGATAVAGLYAVRRMRNANAILPVSQLAMVGAISAASAALAPMATSRLVCPHSPAAGLVEAAASSGIAWTALAATNDVTSANMFLPVQFGAHLVGSYVGRMWLRNKAVAAAEKAAGDARAMSEESAGVSLE